MECIASESMECIAPKPIASESMECVAPNVRSEAHEYQIPSHEPDARRFMNLIDAHPSSISELRRTSIAADCDVVSTSSLVKHAAYNRLLSHALGLLEDVLEERRPDRCALVPKEEALAAKKAARRALDLCDRTLPELDDTIAKLEALREQARASLMGIANDLPALGEAPSS